jgi:diaminohydroxyphosphoribosylaminopyrimidine deaminase / 5-amino-6-(5-phosphoribosylamino)uracil reductase
MTFEIDDYYMRIALKEARKGEGRTSPNPCVGSVIVKGEEIVGKGYHKKAGTPHAEIHALRQAGAKANGATLYVTLEPCSHTGRTPPCCEAIARSGVARLVMGMVDPNPVVQGRGAEFLKKKGLVVHSGVLEAECRALNRPFIKHISTGRPWVVMKAGLSLDGKISYQCGKPGWMTSAESLAVVHRLRDSMDAIMVGIGTVAVDNPSLTTRLTSGRTGKDPIRVVVDSRLSISENAKVVSQRSEAPTWIFCGYGAETGKIERLEARGVTIVQLDLDEDGGVDLQKLLDFLGRKGVMSLLVEGGARLHGNMLRQRLYDFAHLFYGPVFSGDEGVPLLNGYKGFDKETAVRLDAIHSKRLGNDIMISGNFCYSS